MGGPWRRVGGEATEAKQTRRKGKKAAAAATATATAAALACRLKREDCWSTKHDSAFSRWEILIGSSDWESYSLGKDGAERYRIHNLPSSCSCPGLYELGVSNIPANTRKFDPKNIVVVYLGQTENVRTRLQQYGRTGSHLECGDSIVLPNKDISNVFQRGPGLFKEIFSKGFSIMFRWALVRSKLEAMNLEACLLKIFDYAWNRIGNDACRRDDILLKLDKLTKINSFHSLVRKLQRWKWQVLRKKQEGIRIISSEPFKKDGSLNYMKYKDTEMVNFDKIQQKIDQEKDHLHLEYDICGVIKDDGSICKKKPISRRKRCEEHKGKRINRSIKVSEKEFETRRTPIHCGVVLEDGLVCPELPSSGRKRCNFHKGRRIRDSKSGMLL